MPAETSSYLEQIDDPLFREAIDFADAGHTEALAAHLAANPGLIHRRVHLSDQEYFGEPTLLEFIAENPVRQGTMPPNVLAIARTLLDAGARSDTAALDRTLGLVASGRIARETGYQSDLINLLCKDGADPDAALHPALAHGEFSAVRTLLDQGAQYTLPVAAGLGDLDGSLNLLPLADPLARHQALAVAAQFGHASIVHMLLDAGEDPNRLNPTGFHAHSTPLHQAVWGRHLSVVRLLVECGAHLEARDTLWNGTPADWARYGGFTGIQAYLLSCWHG